MRIKESVAQAGLLALGLGASLVLLVDYSSAAGALCGVGGGCDEVKSSAFANLAGIPTPLFGLVFFSALLLSAALGWPGRGLRWLAAGAGALVAVLLLALQAFAIGAFCNYCLIADVSALAYFVLLSLSRDRDPEVRAHRLPLAAASLALAGLFYLGVASTRAAPEATSSATSDLASVPSQAGIATIVEFVDFQCPWCRKLHDSLSELLEPYGDRVQVVRRHLPLDQHEHAITAARSYSCAEEAGLGEAMADRLFSATELGPEACDALALEIGVDPKAYGRCMVSSRPDEQLARDAVEARKLGVRGLPTLFVGDRRFDGVPDEATLIASIERELLE